MRGLNRFFIVLLVLSAIILLAGCQQDDPLAVTRLVEVETQVTTQVEVTRIVVQERDVEATRIVEEAHKIARERGSNVVSIMKDLISDLKKR